ncbi:MAG: plasmid mobilization relaxosome protein MobC [Bacteroidetes bacterium]|nr:plasmid mobilization relaxosome protein MobC [Bacteroidota bacterium]
MQKETKLWLRVSKSEKEKIKKISSENGLNMTEFVLHSCMRKTVQNKTDYNLYKAAIHQVSQEINAIGNNINQVTHAIHIHNKKGISIEKQIEQFNELMSHYLKAHEEMRNLLKASLHY